MIRGSEIRERRRRLGLSIHALGTLIEADPGLISRFENSQYEPPLAMERKILLKLQMVEALQETLAPASFDVTDIAALKILVHKLETGKFQGYAKLTGERLATLAQLHTSVEWAEA